jgi:hypothetical protein
MRIRPPSTALARAARAAAVLALASFATLCAGEKFVYLGTQPDGSEIHVQAAPATTLPDGRRQGWFRMVPKVPQTVTDEYGFSRQYADMLALNVADCSAQSMGAASMTYRDGTGTAVARFELPPPLVELRTVRHDTLGESMFVWLCPTKNSAPTAAPPAGSATPSKQQR